MRHRSEKSPRVIEKVKPTFPSGKTVFNKDTTTSAFLVPFSKLLQYHKTDTFTDVTFSVRGKNFTAHKLILAVHSPVFEAMFSNPMLEATSGQVVVDDVEPRIFEIFLTFLYTGIEPRIDEKETVDLFICADKYGVKSLMATCEKMLNRKMTAENVIELYLMAEAYRRPALRRSALHLMGLHMADIVKTEGWNMIQGNTEQLRKIVNYTMKKHDECANFEFFRPRGRRDLVLGVDVIKMVVVVNRETMTHLCPQEFKLRQQHVNIHGHVTFFEDKNDNNRIVATATMLEVVSASPMIPETDITFEVSISTQENPNDIIDTCKTSILWCRESVHETMRSPRYIIYEENHVKLPRAGPLFVEIKFSRDFMVERTRIKYHHDDGLYKIDGQVVSKGSVYIKGDGFEVGIPCEVLCERTRSLFLEGQNFNVPDTPKDTLETLLRIMHLRKTPFGSRVLPSRDAVDLRMLRAACKLRMDYDLILYLEHALVWDLDPGNCLDMIEAGTDLGLGFLKHGALLYFKVHFERMIRHFPENWSRAKPSVLKEILLDLNRNIFQKKSYLPNFLTNPRRPRRLPRNSRTSRIAGGIVAPWIGP